MKHNGMAKLTSAIGAVTLVCFLAGCGSSSSTGSNSTGSKSTGSGVNSEAAAAVNALLTRPTSIGITEPIKGGVPKGKRIAYLQCGVPDCALIGDSMQKATSQVGWSMTRIPTGTSPENVAAAWQEALRQQPDGIVMTGGYPVAYYRSEIAQATAKHIPVIAMAQSDQGKPFDLVIGSGTVQGTMAGKIAAEWIASKISGGNVLAVNIPGIGAVESEISSFQSELPKLCPSCTVQVLSVPVSSIGTNASTLIANYLLGHQSTKYMYLTTIDLASGLQSAMAANGGKAVPTIGAVQSNGGLDEIKNHQAGLEATVSWVDIEAAFRAVDGFARYMRGQSLAPDMDSTLPQWLITAANMPPERPLPVVANYIQQFDSLWGVK
ncbi:MAG: ABC-type sugar transport system periplasmic component-like protein [Marmoricola sp.]|nr:ABC-type sugar transport system periplasmic component-like protein [Marmoricola sp.]